MAYQVFQSTEQKNKAGRKGRKSQGEGSSGVRKISEEGPFRAEGPPSDEALTRALPGEGVPNR